MATYIIVAVIAYLIGSINFSKEWQVLILEKREAEMQELPIC